MQDEETQEIPTREEEVKQWLSRSGDGWSEIPQGYSPLTPRWCNLLKELPETGDGYHKVDIVLSNDHKIHATAYNCRMLDIELDPNMIKEMKVS